MAVPKAKRGGKTGKVLDTAKVLDETVKTEKRKKKAKYEAPEVYEGGGTESGLPPPADLSGSEEKPIKPWQTTIAKKKKKNQLQADKAAEELQPDKAAEELQPDKAAEELQPDKAPEEPPPDKAVEDPTTPEGWKAKAIVDEILDPMKEESAPLLRLQRIMADQARRLREALARNEGDASKAVTSPGLSVEEDKHEQDKLWEDQVFSNRRIEPHLLDKAAEEEAAMKKIEEDKAAEKKAAQEEENRLMEERRARTLRRR